MKEDGKCLTIPMDLRADDFHTSEEMIDAKLNT